MESSIISILFLRNNSKKEGMVENGTRLIYLHTWTITSFMIIIEFEITYKVGIFGGYETTGKQYICA